MYPIKWMLTTEKKEVLEADIVEGDSKEREDEGFQGVVEAVCGISFDRSHAVDCDRQMCCYGGRWKLFICGRSESFIQNSAGGECHYKY